MHLTERNSGCNPANVGSEQSESAGAPDLREIERVDDARRKARELTNRCNNLPAFEVFGFAQAYLRGEMKLGMLHRLGNKTDGGFLIAALHPTGGDGAKFVHLGVGGDAVWSDGNAQEPRVLSDNVKIVEGIDKPIPSAVRFQIFDDKSFSLRERLYEFGTLVLPPSKARFALRSGEISVICKVLAVAVGERDRENIQAAANHIDVSASLNLELQRKGSFYDRHHEIIDGIVWRLFDDRIDVILEPGIETLLEDWELGYGPIDRGLCV
jgi:hypothetical protein